MARPDPSALYKANPKLAGFLIRETYNLMDVPYSLIGRLWKKFCRVQSSIYEFGRGVIAVTSNNPQKAINKL